MTGSFEITPIGYVRSPYREVGDAPKQGREKGDLSTIELLPEYADAAEGLSERGRLIVLTWMDRADRSLLRIAPFGMDRKLPTGVLNTRTPNRPNPVGICNVELTGVEGRVLTVRGLDSVDGTPVIDIKPFIASLDG